MKENLWYSCKLYHKIIIGNFHLNIHLKTPVHTNLFFENVNLVLLGKASTEMKLSAKSLS